MSVAHVIDDHHITLWQAKMSDIEVVENSAYDSYEGLSRDVTMIAALCNTFPSYDRPSGTRSACEDIRSFNTLKNKDKKPRPAYLFPSLFILPSTIILHQQFSNHTILYLPLHFIIQVTKINIRISNLRVSIPATIIAPRSTLRQLTGYTILHRLP